MNNTHLLFSLVDNKEENEKEYKEKLIIRIKDYKLSIKGIKKIVESCSFIFCDSKPVDVIIDISSGIISDEATIVLLEIIIYHIIKYNKGRVKVRQRFHKNSFSYTYYQNSILSNWDNDQYINENKYIGMFEEPFDANRHHYRRMVKKVPDLDKSDFISKVSGDIDTFVSPYFENKKYKDCIVEISGELLGNALEHTTGDCIFSMTTRNFDTQKGRKKLLNIVVINISNETLDSCLKLKIENDAFIEERPGDSLLKKAYNNHKKGFNDSYDLESFCLLSAFQYSITTREEGIETGGTGLTQLIKTLSEQSISQLCYVMSGNKILYFKKEFLKLNEDNTIGFNKSNSYIDDLPEEENLQNYIFPIKGTVYNLSFILGGGENEK